MFLCASGSTNNTPQEMQQWQVGAQHSAQLSSCQSIFNKSQIILRARCVFHYEPSENLSPVSHRKQTPADID